MNAVPEVVSTLCLPRLSNEIPVEVNKSAVTSLFAERYVLGLPTIYPDPKLHTSIKEVMLKNIKALGFTPNAFSEKHFGIGLCIDSGEMDNDSVTMETCYVLTLDDCDINLHATTTALNKAFPGLGEAIWYWMKEANISSGLPGVSLPTDVLDLFVDFKLESAQTDKEAIECLAQLIDDSDEVESYLPSTLTKKLGGASVIRPKEPKTPKSLAKDLKSVGIKDGARIADILTKELPQRIKAILELLRGEGAIPHLTSYQLFNARLWAHKGDEPERLQEFRREMMDDMGNNGDSLDNMFIQRVGLNLKEKVPTHKAHDGLVVVAKVLNALTTMDELIDRLLTVPVQIKEFKKNAHQSAKSGPSGSAQSAAGVRKQVKRASTVREFA
jgi:PRTRC genetic system protein F